MSDSDDPPTGPGNGATPLSALNRRRAKARSARADRLARTLRANIGRRKQQAQARNEEARNEGARDAAGPDTEPAPGSEDPDKPRT